MNKLFKELLSNRNSKAKIMIISNNNWGEYRNYDVGYRNKECDTLICIFENIDEEITYIMNQYVSYDYSNDSILIRKDNKHAITNIKFITEKDLNYVSKN